MHACKLSEDHYARRRATPAKTTAKSHIEWREKDRCKLPRAVVIPKHMAVRPVPIRPKVLLPVSATSAGR